MPPLDPASEFARLVQIMATLRAPGGCPWDREQTIDSLKPYVLEETYELLEAIDSIDSHDHEAIREELGDFLFEAVFVAQLEAEAGHFGIADAVRAVADKLIRRHPHVFRRHEGEPALDTAGQVRTRWEILKAQERGGAERPRPLLAGIPEALPALLRAHQVSGRAASVGFDWTGPGDVLAKIQEEVDEIKEAVSAGRTADRAHAEEEVGDLLFAIANLSRKLGIEPETALRKANAKFMRRFTAMEERLREGGASMAELSAEALDEAWRAVKGSEDSAGPGRERQASRSRG
jgi:MazG family protein